MSTPSPRRRRPSPLVLIAGAVAVVIAFGGAFFLNNRGSGSGGPPAGKTTILAAARDVGTGKALTADDVTTTDIDIPPTGAIVQRADAVGKIARQDIAR